MDRSSPRPRSLNETSAHDDAASIFMFDLCRLSSRIRQRSHEYVQRDVVAVLLRSPQALRLCQFGKSPAVGDAAIGAVLVWRHDMDVVVTVRTMRTAPPDDPFCPVFLRLSSPLTCGLDLRLEAVGPQCGQTGTADNDDQQPTKTEAHHSVKRCARAPVRFAS